MCRTAPSPYAAAAAAVAPTPAAAPLAPLTEWLGAVDCARVDPCVCVRARRRVGARYEDYVLAKGRGTPEQHARSIAVVRRLADSGYVIFAMNSDIIAVQVPAAARRSR